MLKIEQDSQKHNIENQRNYDMNPTLFKKVLQSLH